MVSEPFSQTTAMESCKTVEIAPPSAVMIRERIAQLAYSYWEARGRQGGSPQEDWLRAEREVLLSLESSDQ